jgi:hypothetical protein
MVTIGVKNSDSRLWNTADVVIEIMQAIHKDQDIELDMLYEGCCIESLGLYSILDKICYNTGYDPGRINIIVYNFLEKHPRYNIRYNIINKVANFWLTTVREKTQEFVKQPIGPNTKHFGHFVGHGNRFRLIVGSHLYYHHPGKALQTYHCVPTNDYHREFVSLEDILYYKHGYDKFQQASMFLKHTPLTLDAVDQYPINKEKLTDILDAYHRIFVDIVPQSYYTGNVFQLDEKFWRAVATRTPFLIQGPQGFINNLHCLGFKTFSRWWDEGYSEDPIDYQIKPLLANIDTIATWSTQKLAQVYDEMLPTLEHNHQRFLSLTKKELMNLCN